MASKAPKIEIPPVKVGLVKRWIKALRSGKYQQTTGYLHLNEENADFERKPGYCCLGVLAELAGKSVDEIEARECLDDVGLEILGPFNKVDDGPYAKEAPTTHTTLQRRLAAMNDSGKSFKYIASWLKRSLLPKLGKKKGKQS